MSTSFLSTFLPDRFSNLRSLLSGLFSTSDVSQEHLKEVYSELDKARPWFLNLLNVPPPNKEERDLVEKGTVKIGSKTVRINPEFIAETLFLSSQLGLSELLSVHLLRSGIALQSRHGNRPASDTAVIIFHMERLDMLACLKLIFDPAVGGGGGALEVLDMFGRELVESTVNLGGGKEGRLVERAMLDLESTKETVGKLLQSLGAGGASSTTTVANNQFAPPPPPSGGAKLSLEMTQERISSLKQERKSLGHVLFLMSYSRKLRKREVQRVVQWLSRQGGEGLEGDDVLIGYMVATALAAFDLSELNNPNTDHDRIVQERFVKDPQFISVMTSAIVEAPWKHEPLQSVIILQWTLFLVTAVRYNSDTYREARTTEEGLETTVLRAIRGDAFQFLTTKVVGVDPSASQTIVRDLSSSQAQSGSAVGGAGALASTGGRGGRKEDVVDPDFRWYILTQVDSLVSNFITTMFSVFKKLRHREEDLILASQPSSRPSRSLGVSLPPTTAPRADVEALFILIATIYRDSPPDAGLKYWVEKETRLPAFLSSAADVKTPGMMKALFEMLASLSVGPQSSMEAFHFLSSAGSDPTSGPSNGNSSSDNSCSWSRLFEALSSYANLLPKVNEAAQSSIQSGLPPQPRRDPNAPTTIKQDEIALLKSFLRLLQNVVQSSPVARAALHNNPTFKAIPTLLSLVNSIISIDLKAALFDTLAAFCGAEGGSLGTNLAKQMWVSLEKFEVIPTKSLGSNGLYRSTGLAGSRRGASGGIMAELEESETTARTYPATTSFVHLLNSLIHTPAKAATLLDGFEVESQTIPDALGAGTRTPGIVPYVRYVLDDVFLKAPQLAYSNPTERWKLTERSLCFVEKCLASYDLSPLLVEDALGISSLGKGQQPASSSLLNLARHPGFEILRRFLTEPALLKGLFDVLSVGFDGLTEDGGQTPLLAKSVLRSLRIVYRILQIQSLFIEVLLPTLAESQISLGTSSYPSSVAPLDQHLLYAHPVVVQIALLVNFVEDPELVLLSVKTITLLSQSSFFVAVDRFENVYSSHMNRLVGIIDSSDESLRILDGYVRRLEADEEEDLAWPQDDPIESLVTSDAESSSSKDLTQAIRFAILDLLLQNTTQGAPGPNVAHFLAGFDLNRPASEMSIEDPQAQGARISCLHIVFELLAQGAPRETDGAVDQSEFAIPSLLTRNPGLAEKCSRLVYQLCVHDLTASATTRYIRTREDYCFRQLLVFPMSPPSISYGSLGHVVHANGQQTPTSAGGITSFLRYRSSLLDTVALELHVINPTGLHAAKLVDTLFTSPSTMLDDFEAHVRHAETTDQPLVRILDILLSLDFEWQDEIPDPDIKLAYFSTLDFGTCLRMDERGCEVYDFRALVSAMKAVRRQHQQIGALSTLGQQEAIAIERKSILLALAVENHRRQIGHAKHQCLVSWQRTLDVVLFKSFELIPLDQRESVIFDIMQAVFHLIGASDTTPAAAELLCQVVLSLITKLRQGRREQVIFSSEEEEVSGALPADKLLVVLRRVLDSVCRAGTSELVRGNLYTVLINYLQLLSSFSAVEPSPKLDLGGAMDVEDDAMEGSVGGASTSAGFRSGQRSPLEVGTVAILTAGMERLAPVLARDALDGSEIWKTVAYTTLECLVTASREDRSHRLLAILSRNGYLQSFVQSLKDTEEDLLNVLAPDPDNFNSLYVFEAKASLLIRIAQSQFGAERILESRLFEVLSQCHFIDARPEMDQTYLDLDSFLPPVIERFHQILLPTLQLAVGTLSSLGPSSHAALHQALSFVDAHRETILLILKDNSAILPLAVVKEFHLLATLFHFVLPRVEPGDLGLPSGFGAYHLALLGLGGRFFLREKWEDQLVPVNDSERADAETPSPDASGVMLFDYNADRAVEDLNKSLLSYFVLATESTASRGLRPVLVPATSSREAGLMPKHGAPTITAAISLLYEMTVYLTSTIDRTRELSSKLAQPSSIGTEEIEDIIVASGVDLSTRYSTGQRHQLALQSLARSRKATRQQSLSALFIVESLLLLLWRHLLHYVNDSLQDGPDSNWATVLPSTVSLRFSQGPSGADLMAASGRRRGGGAKEMWERASEDLNPALKRLEGVELSSDIFGSDARLRQSYLAILTRRLRELDQAFAEEER
ncbi:nucleoporin Nup186/Nup192/Nup205 [Mrakia frigida]|uniref:Nup192p n=1 Tax=Mrakia frigida TaxID=29902 RepID=UPI003FCC2145